LAANEINDVRAGELVEPQGSIPKALLQESGNMAQIAHGCRRRETLIPQQVFSEAPFHALTVAQQRESSRRLRDMLAQYIDYLPQGRRFTPCLAEAPLATGEKSLRMIGSNGGCAEPTLG